MIDWSPLVLISTLGIHMGFHVAETRRNVQVSSHSCGECRRVLFCSSWPAVTEPYLIHNEGNNKT